MKALFTKLTILVVTALSLGLQANAKIWRVNNNGTSPVPAILADFPANTTLQQVNDNASVLSGDTIHLEQSPVSYGPCIFTKRLVVLGPGYFLSKNPNTQVNTAYGVIVGALTFYNPASAGSYVYGLEVSTVNMGVNNLTVARCYFNAASCLIGNVSTGNIDGMTLRQCFFDGNVGATNCIRNNSGTGLITNMNFYGNSIIPSQYGIALDNRVSGIFKNNLVYAGFTPIALQNFYVVNNLTVSTSGNYPNSFINCNVEYNAGQQASHFVSGMNGTGTVYGPGNSTKTIAQMGFIGGASTDGYWQLGPATLVAGIGKDGADLGAFAGDHPYKLSGLPPIPNIYGLTIAPISAGASSISVTVTAKGNN